MTELFDRTTGEAVEATPDCVLVCFALYQQEAAKQKHWRAHRFLTDPIRKAIKARLAEGGGMESWREALGIASRSDFLQGNIKQPGKERFRMDLNFFTRPASYEKILSGFYSREPDPPPRIHIPTGGRMPQQAPAEPFKHDLETPAQRMAFTIERKRFHGDYAGANYWEEKLAVLEKRPPVLVPAPEVAFTSHPEKAAPAPRNRPPVTDVIAEQPPGWVDEPLPDSAYGED